MRRIRNKREKGPRPERIQTTLEPTLEHVRFVHNLFFSNSKEYARERVSQQSRHRSIPFEPVRRNLISSPTIPCGLQMNPRVSLPFGFTWG